MKMFDKIVNMISLSLEKHDLKDLDKKLTQISSEIFLLIKFFIFLHSDKVVISWNKVAMGCICIYFKDINKQIDYKKYKSLSIIIEKIYPVFIVVKEDEIGCRFEIYIRRDLLHSGEVIFET